jgi:FkbM family methyltransferase
MPDTPLAPGSSSKGRISSDQLPQTPRQELVPAEADAFLEYLFSNIARRPRSLNLREGAGVARYLKALAAETAPGPIRSLLDRLAEMFWAALLQSAPFRTAEKTAAVEFMEIHANTYLASYKAAGFDIDGVLKCLRDSPTAVRPIAKDAFCGANAPCILNRSLESKLRLLTGEPARHRYRIAGTPIEVNDEAGSRASDYVAGELTVDTYGLRRFPFCPGDCVVDIGGHIGLFAIWLAKRHPGLRIYSYEPHPGNRRLFDRNLSLNAVSNVTLYPEAVSGDNRLVSLGGSAINSGAASAHATTLKYGRVEGISSLTLDQIFARHNIERCRLLKIDCEGSEYEALNDTAIWPRLEFLCGEFHLNSLLRSQGHTPDRLLELCTQRLGPGRIKVSFCQMSE